jgi:tellurite resistance protein
MVDVKIEELQSAKWATEATLRKISEFSSMSNETLKAIAKSKGIESVQLDKLDLAAKSAAGNISDLGKSAPAAGKGLDTLNRSVDDLKYSLRSTHRSLTGLITGAGDPIRGFSNVIGDVIGHVGRVNTVLQKMPAKLKIAGMVVGASVTAIGERLLEAADSYSQIMQSGVMFNGSIFDFVSTVRKSGTSLKAASAIAEKHSTSLLITGEKKFFDTVGAMTGTFSKFGMTIDQGAESLGELMEIQRASGFLYNASQQDLIEANTKLITQFESQARLTGISVKRQMEQQKQVAEQAQLRILTQGLSKEQRERITDLNGQLSSRGFSTEQITGILKEAITGVATESSGRLRSIAGSSADVLVSNARQAINGGNTDISESLDSFQKKVADIPMGIRTSLAYGKNAELMNGVADITQNMLDRKAGDNAKARQLDYEKIINGVNLLDTSTSTLFSTMNEVVKTAGKVEASIFENLKDPMNIFIESLKDATAYLHGLAGEHSGAIRNGLGIVGVGIAARYGLNRISGNNPSDISKLVPGSGTESLSTLAAEKTATDVAKKTVVTGATKWVGKWIPLLGDAIQGYAYSNGSVGRGTAAFLGSLGGRAVMGAAGAEAGGLPGLITQGIGSEFGAEKFAGAYDNLASWYDNMFGQTTSSTSTELAQNPGAISEGLDQGVILLANKLDSIIMELSADGPLYKLLMDLSQITQDGHRKLVTAVQNN